MKLPFLAPLFFCLFSLPSYADEVLTIENAWLREGPPVAKVLAGFMSITNNSDQDVILTGGKSDDFESIEFHRTIFEDGMARMMKQNKLLIPAKGQLTLEPSGYHLMLLGAKRSLTAGDEITLQLYTETDHCIDQILTVRKTAGDEAVHHHHHHH